MLLQSLRVCVTGAAGQIAYSLLYSVARGDVFGADKVSCSQLQERLSIDRPTSYQLGVVMICKAISTSPPNAVN